MHTPRQIIARELAEAVRVGDVGQKIAAALVLRASEGDPNALRLLLELTDEYAGARACTHPSQLRKNMTTMGGGPVREVCACGTLLVDGVAQSTEG